MPIKIKRVTRALALAATLAALALTPTTTRSITQADIDDASERAKDYQNQITTTNEHSEKMGQEAQKSYGDYMKRSDEVKKWQDRIDYKDDKMFVREKPETSPQADTASSGLLASDERIYIFISSSMPKQTIENYAKSMDKIRDSKIVMVLRGCIGGCEKIMPTARWIQDIIAPSEDRQLAAEVIIDPFLFSLYNIEAVPTIIYAKNVKTDMDEGSEGLTINLKEKPKAYSVLGDVSLAYALDKISEESKAGNLKQISKMLGENFYGR